MKTIVASEPEKYLQIVYEDESYKFVDYGESADQEGKTKWGLFVHSKSEDRWLQITEISTVDGMFGSSDSDDPDDMKRNRRYSRGFLQVGITPA